VKKASLPLFFRLLFWFFLNVIILLAALWLTLRIEFGAQYPGLLPNPSHAQAQAMAEVLIGDLAKTPRERWGDVLSRLGMAYHMEFALFDPSANEMAGPPMDPPAETRSMILMTSHAGPPGARPSSGQDPPISEGALPQAPPADALPDDFRPPPPDGAPPQGPPPGPAGPRSILPDFPQNVIRTEHPETYWLLVHLPMHRLGQPGIGPAMLIGRTQHPNESPLLFNPNPWVQLAAGMILFSALFWLVITRSLTGALGKMTRATEAIAEGQFDLHAPEKRSDELGRLGFAINRMAARLKGFITGQRRFLGDVAHELCSPLARMEVALGILEERSDERAAPYVRDVQEELARLRKLAHELLSFSKAALGENRIKLEPLPVLEIVEAAVRQERSDTVPVRIDVPAGLRLQTHAELLGRAVANLLRNAIRYAGQAGPVTVSAWEEGAETVVAVADEGPGVPPHEIERLFDPFYRLDESRTADTGGAGLGLAIVKTCAEACRGTVRAFNREPHGLEVQLRFPR
jgi:two-component system sensor histidine kinase CpxA